MRRLAIGVFLTVVCLPIGSWARTIQWSGYEWEVKAKKQPMGPGPNLWSDSQRSVWVDDRGRLNLKVRKIHDQWHAAEVYMLNTLGHGKYVFYLDSRVDQLDTSVVVGLFIHATDTNEIDIEFSKWGQERKYTYHQFVLQPRIDGSNIKRSDYRSRKPQSTHGFVWSPEGVAFRSYEGHEIKDKRPYKWWDYTGPNNPPLSNQKVHINLWLYKGQPPTDGNEVLLVIDRFVFVPYSKQEKEPVATITTEEKTQPNQDQ